MKEYSYIATKVKKMLTEARYAHSERVENEAVKLAQVHGADVDKCRIASIMHDMAKNLPDETLFQECVSYGVQIDNIEKQSPQLLHGKLASEYCRKEFGIDDEEIINAIRFHTTGRVGMSLVEKIVYLADLIEVGRSFQGVEELRELAYKDLEAALLTSCNITLEHILKKNFLIHPLTVEFRNSLLLEGGE